MRASIPNLVRHTFLLVALVLLQHALPGQIPSAIPVELIDQDAGLTFGSCDYTYKDSHGFVWIGTRGGLYRFDGKTCRLYMPVSGDSTTVPASWVYTFFIEDTNTNIWFSTPVGVTRYVRRLDEFETFEVPGGGNANQVCFASGLDGHGQLWFTNGEGIFTIHTETTEITRRGDFHHMLWVSELRLDANGHVAYLFAYSRYDHFPGLFIYELDQDTVTRSWSAFTGDPGEGMMVMDVEVLDGTTLLIATQGKCLTYDWRTGERIEHAPPLGTQGEWTASCLAALNDSMILVGTLDHGYYAYNTRTASFTWHKHLVHGGDIVTDRPYMINKDHDGGVWISLATAGVAYFHPSNLVFDHYPLWQPSASEALRLAVQCIAEIDSNTLLIGANGGGYFVHLEKGVPASISRCTQCPPVLRSLYRDRRGRIWMSYEGDILVMDRQQEVHPVRCPDSISFNYDFCELPNTGMLLFA
ncbi:MAG: hypothetical protein R3301_19355, partial [Saprospiraceae bacterium]|nr:hypothetical protein [Saprospiraceae bacterium]